MFPQTGLPSCPTPSPCAWLSHAPSTMSESNFHHRFRLPMVNPFGWRTPPDGEGEDGYPRFLGTSPFHACRALRPRRSLQQPRPYWLPTVAFQVVHPVGLRFRYSSYEAPSLHLRYGLRVALSTLDLRRYLRRAKTRFAVGWLVPSATGISPAGCARIIRAHERCSNLF